MPLFKLTTGITHPIGPWSRSAGRHCLSAGTAIPLALIPHRQLKSCMVCTFNLFTESSLGSWAVLVAWPHEGLFQVSAGPHFIIIPVSYPVCAYLNTHRFHRSHSFLIYSTDYIHIFTDTFTEKDNRLRVVFLTENKTH